MHSLRGHIKMTAYPCLTNESSPYGGNTKHSPGFELQISHNLLIFTQKSSVPISETKLSGLPSPHQVE